MNVKFNGFGQKNVNEVNFKVATGEKKNAKQIQQEKIQQQKTNGKTLKGYELNLANDPVSQKIEKARKEAMKKLTDVMQGHMDIADDMQKRADHIEDLNKEILDNQKQLDDINKNKEELAKQYAGNEDSKEYKDQLMQLDKQAEEFQSRVNSAKNMKDGESKAIEATHLALLKADPMVGAQKAADDIMDKANKEVINDLVSEAKDKTDEKMEDQVEKAQDEKEEKKEEEKKKVEQEKKQEELEERIEEVREDNKSPEEVKAENDDLDTTNDIIQNADSTQNKLKDEIKNILKTQQLVEDDLKGLEVDNIL